VAVTAIDRMCSHLTPGGRFSRDLFCKVNDDPGLLDELYPEPEMMVSALVESVGVLFCVLLSSCLRGLSWHSGKRYIWT
jgi:hypothetical protein